MGSKVIFFNIDFTELIAAVSSTVLSIKKGKIIKIGVILDPFFIT